MATLDEFSYSRDETIAAITDYYQFLTKMYLKESRVIYPPPDGWPNIVNCDPKVLETLGKSDEVIGLLAHLPYIVSNDVCGYANAAPDCVFADWQDEIQGFEAKDGQIKYAINHMVCFEGCIFVDFANPHVVGLVCCGQDDTPVILLDTELGIIHWESDTCPRSMAYTGDVDWDPECENTDDEEDDDDDDDEDDDEDGMEDDDDDNDDNDGEDNDAVEYAAEAMTAGVKGLNINDDMDVSIAIYMDQDDNEDDSEQKDRGHKKKRTWEMSQDEKVWRYSAETWTIPGFFEAAKENFRTLQWIPTNSVFILDVTHMSPDDPPGLVPMLQDIYRQHGWPDLDRYRKDECLEAVQKALTEHYPEFANETPLH
jgi:hypothetical protein